MENDDEKYIYIYIYIYIYVGVRAADGELSPIKWLHMTFAMR